MRVTTDDIHASLIRAIEDLPNLARSDVLSLFLVGSAVAKEMGAPGDLDLVLILRSNIRAKNVYLIGTKLRSALCRQIGNAFLFCDPVCEQCEFTRNRFRVHLIPHFYRRIQFFIRTENPVVYSWARQYRMIYGRDYLKNCRGKNLGPLSIDEPWGVEDLREHLYSFLISKNPLDNRFASGNILQYISGRLIEISSRSARKKAGLPPNIIRQLEKIIQETNACETHNILNRLAFLDTCFHALRKSLRRR